MSSEFMDTGDKALFFEKPALTSFPFNHLDHAHAYFPFFPAILKVRLSQSIKNKDSTVIPQNVMLASRIPVTLFHLAFTPMSYIL